MPSSNVMNIIVKAEDMASSVAKKVEDNFRKLGRTPVPPTPIPAKTPWNFTVTAPPLFWRLVWKLCMPLVPDLPVVANSPSVPS